MVIIIMIVMILVMIIASIIDNDKEQSLGPGRGNISFEDMIICYSICVFNAANTPFLLIPSVSTCIGRRRVGAGEKYIYVYIYIYTYVLCTYTYEGPAGQKKKRQENITK